MIGVICRPKQRALAAELFQLLKVAWCWADPMRAHDVLLVTDPDADDTAYDTRLVLRFGAGAGKAVTSVRFIDQANRLPLYAPAAAVTRAGDTIGVDEDDDTVAIERREPTRTTIFLGYDLLAELGHLLVHGQPDDQAPNPTLDLHLDLLRRWFLKTGAPLAEIVPRPFDAPYTVCLTHDIDFAGIRRHGLDHTVLGFAYRASVETLTGVLRGTRTWRQFARNLAALVSLPFVHLGLIRDFWEPFRDYAAADGDLPSTYFVIPFRDRAGERVTADRAALRATRYDVSDIADLLPVAEARGCEIAVHGIDAWHSVDAGRAERAAVGACAGHLPRGIRMHWLCYEDDTPTWLEEAGFEWDATFGYNGAVGYRAGTTQIFAPPGTDRLLQVPLHAQDTALFLSRRLHLTEDGAWAACSALREHARAHGGVLVVTWHDRSLAPERLWDTFYRRLLDGFRSDGARCATVSEAVSWARLRRSARILEVERDADQVRVRLAPPGTTPDPAFLVRVEASRADGSTVSAELPWRGEEILELHLPQDAAPTLSA